MSSLTPLPGLKEAVCSCAC